ncbi:hypothetical protein ACJBUE_18780 (plasmid) [Ralstonia syzygii subsp. celebesensis]|uniref:hypothetical protein n=1 Tax=Ralstonia syzygii TaxID=28097 RepID=UPI000B3B467E|nr:aankyrin [Ralstonia solanacearum]
MGALLKIVQPSAVAAQESACRVFNAGLVERLAAMNAAARVLRGMGYRIVREELCEGSGHRPMIEIARDRMDSLIPLLDRAVLTGRRPYWLTLARCTRVAIDLMGVTVTCVWEQV